MPERRKLQTANATLGANTALKIISSRASGMTPDLDESLRHQVSFTACVPLQRTVTAESRQSQMASQTAHSNGTHKSAPEQNPATVVCPEQVVSGRGWIGLLALMVRDK
jgi:hypothetical protein